MSKSKILIILLSIPFALQFGFSYDFKTNCQEKVFVVTAYYSPKSSQAFYYKDTYEDEKTLNGEGLYGASGKGVFNGMLAAPSSYDFGGLIYFPSLGGIGEVADRGGAIVHSGEKGQSYDRIDVWMGTGESGLVKALVFGKQTITGYYCNAQTVKSKGIKAKIGFNLGAIPIQKYFFDSSLFIQELKYGREDVRVYKLQEYLMKFGYLNKKTGYFGDETKNALCKYQVTRGLSSWKYCGTFGSKTRYFMKNEAKTKGFLPDFTKNTTTDDLINYAKNYKYDEVGGVKNDELKMMDKKTTPKITNYFNEPYKNGTVNEKIGNLQDMLRHYGFYDGDITDTYDKKTVQAVYNFQLAVGILKKDDTKNTARGWMGPSTRNKLNEKRDEFQKFKNNEGIKINSEEGKGNGGGIIKDEEGTEPLKITNYFTEPYKNGTINEKIGNLQDMLRHYGFYDGDLTNTYDKKTINAVYHFQVFMGILDKNDTKNTAKGWMGPSTRNKLNEKRDEFQKFKNNEKLKVNN